MKTLLAASLLVASFLLMGIALPACPGQEELKQQIASLQTTNQQLTRKLMEQDTQLKTLVTDMGQVKQLLPQMTNVIQTDRADLATLKTTVEALQAHRGKVAVKKPPAKK